MIILFIFLEVKKKRMNEKEFYKRVVQFLSFGKLNSVGEENELTIALHYATLSDMQSIIDAMNQREKTDPQFLTITTPWGFRYRAWMWNEGTEKKIFVYLPFEYLNEVRWGSKYAFVMGYLDGFRISGVWQHLQLSK